MNLIFLDFDGVINHPGTYQARVAGDRSIPVDPLNMKRLNWIVDSTPNVALVISSSWRRYADWQTLADNLRLSGLRASVIGETPDLTPGSRAYCQPLIDSTRIADVRSVLEVEVSGWLRLCTHPPVESFVILDDLDDAGCLQDRLVNVQGNRGLHDEDVERAVRLLATPVASPIPAVPATWTRDELILLFSRHCECRPFDVTRDADDHAAIHECDMSILADIQLALGSGHGGPSWNDTPMVAEAVVACEDRVREMRRVIGDVACR